MNEMIGASVDTEALILGENSMKIEKLDENFAKIDSGRQDVVFHNAKSMPIGIFGLEWVESEGLFSRIDPQKAEEYRFSDNLRELMHHTSGGRIRFRTDASEVVIRVQLDERVRLPHLSPVAAMGVDVYEKNADFPEIPRFVTSVPPRPDADNRYEGVCQFRNGGDGMREVTVYLPLYCKVRNLEIGIHKEAILEPPHPYRTASPVTFYGSSITQGACSSRPGNAYPAILSRMLGCDIRNLGFSGNAFGEPDMASYIAGLDMSAFVLDYDYNARSEEDLRNTHYAFYRKIRERHPTLPIVMLSAPVAPPAHTKVWDKRMDMARVIIMESYIRGKYAGDENLYFVDGESLLGDVEATDALLDNVHPTDLGFRQMAHRLYPILNHILYHNR